MSELSMEYRGIATALSCAPNKTKEQSPRIMPVTIIDAEVKFTVKYPDGVIKTHKIIMDGTVKSGIGVSRVNQDEYDNLEDIVVKFDDMIVRKQYAVVSYDKGDVENVGDV